MVDAMDFHFLVDGASHDISWGKRQSLVVFLHKRLPVRQSQCAAISTHCLCYEICRMRLSRMIERCGMELYELHVLHRSLCTVNHSLAVASGYYRVCSGLVNGTASTGTHQRYLTQIGIHLLRVGIQHVCSVTLDIRRASCYYHSEMMLRDNLHSKMVLLDVDIRIAAHCLHQSTLNLSSGVVGMMKNTELRVSALTVKVERAVFLFIEIHSPLHQFFDLRRSISYYLLHSLAVADIVAGNHCVLNMFLEIIYFEVCYRSNSTLCKIGIGLVERSFADKTNLSFMLTGNLQRIAHSCYASADY